MVVRQTVLQVPVLKTSNKALLMSKIFIKYTDSTFKIYRPKTNSQKKLSVKIDFSPIPTMSKIRCTKCRPEKELETSKYLKLNSHKW